MAPFVLGEAHLLVIPAGLVKKILRGDFVDMVELLHDNMKAERRRSTAEGEGIQGQARGSQREIPDILSWLQCFSLYAAVIKSQHPEKLKDLLAYQVLMINEHRRCGDKIGSSMTLPSGSR